MKLLEGFTSWPLENHGQVGLNLYNWSQDIGPDFLSVSGGGGQVLGWMLIAHPVLKLGVF